MKIEENISDILKEIQTTLRRVDFRELDYMLDAVVKAERIFCAGAGRSGLMMRSFAMRLMHMGLQVYVVGETVTPAIGKSDLLVIGSGSGETKSLLNMAQRAKQAEAHIALLTVIPGSSIGGYADCTVAIPATTAKVGGKVNTRTVQSKGSLFEQCLFMLLETAVLSLMKQKDFDPDAIMTRHANLE
jgi:6-phospho-3-hexuloisomerase